MAGTLILVFFVLVAIFADLISPYDPQDLVAQPAMWPGEDLAYPLGTDSLGRDVLTNLIHGTRASLLVGTWGTPGALMQYAIGTGGALTARTPASVTISGLLMPTRAHSCGRRAAAPDTMGVAMEVP